MNITKIKARTQFDATFSVQQLVFASGKECWRCIIHIGENEKVYGSGFSSVSCVRSALTNLSTIFEAIEPNVLWNSCEEPDD